MDEQNIHLPKEWKKLVEDEFTKPYFETLTERVRGEYLETTVYPAPANIFRSFELCKPSDIKVVILGQDPYHTPGVADGLAFSTKEKNPVPPSLQNIFKEIEQEYGKKCNQNPDLTRWAKQGVLLLNASLSVRKGEANSHAEYGWHFFTDAVIKALSEQEEHIIFLLWGAFAGKKEVLIDWSKHLVLTSPHPSPLSAHRGFLGNNHFKQANEYLKKNGRKEIDWCS
jgi:uracil-DNA glycosylase